MDLNDRGSAGNYKLEEKEGDAKVERSKGGGLEEIWGKRDYRGD